MVRDRPQRGLRGLSMSIVVQLSPNAVPGDRPDLGLRPGIVRARLLAGMERRVRRGCKVLRKLAFIFQGIRPRRWLLVGRLESERGRREKAVAAWRKSEAVAKAMEMEYDLARARVALGGDLGAATETFERLGAIEQLRIAEALS